MFARFYDRMMEDVDYHQLFDVIEPYVLKTDVVLDAGCGSGRLLIELLQEGYQAFGIDNDTDMLSLAEARLREAGFSTRLFVHDLRQPLHVEVNVIVLMFDVLNYMKGIVGVLKRLDQALLPGGTLIFDVYKESVLNDYDGYYEEGDRPLSYTWSIKTTKRHMIHTIHEDQSSTVIRQTVRPLSADLDVLKSMGYDTHEIKGPDPRKHYIVARKGQ
jgi:SAM-dependent methyltransferase